MKEQLWNIKISIALPHLLEHAPDLWYQYLHLLGGQHKGGKKRSPLFTQATDSMEVDSTEAKVQNINLDTTSLLAQRTRLQSVVAKVNDTQDLEFLIDPGAVVSIVGLHTVRRLNKENDIHPTEKTLRYGGGTIDVPVGIVKLKLRFSDEVVIVHTFCVTKNPNTPSLLGMDFMLAAYAIQDPHLGKLTFRSRDLDLSYSVDTQNGEGDQVEQDVPTIVPVAVTTNKNNQDLKDITVDQYWEFEPGDAQLLWLQLNDNSNNWKESKVLQAAGELFSKTGLYVVPTILEKKLDNDPYFCILVCNMSQKKTSIKHGAVLGHLVDRSNVPKGVAVIQSISAIMDIIAEMYITHHDDEESISAPSILMGPIFEPTKAELSEHGINGISYNGSSLGINHITYGPD